MTELVLRIGFSLLVVLGLMWLLARVARRPLSRARTGTGLAVLSRAQLSRSAAVAVVRLGERAVLLGVTDQQVTLLGEADAQQLEVPVREPRRQPVAVPDPELVAGTEPVTGTESVAGPDQGPLAGSLLSPGTWSRTVEFLRERTVRR